MLKDVIEIKNPAPKDGVCREVIKVVFWIFYKKLRRYCKHTKKLSNDARGLDNENQLFTAPLVSPDII